jgi:hypothetical protein
LRLAHDFCALSFWLSDELEFGVGRSFLMGER